jgi:hypothetical protein
MGRPPDFFLYPKNTQENRTGATCARTKLCTNFYDAHSKHCLCNEFKLSIAVRGDEQQRRRAAVRTHPAEASLAAD